MAKRISAQSIQEVTTAADAITIIGEYVRLEKKSGRYWGLCPFHDEKTPSFSVDSSQNLFYCFGCGKGGSILTFLMEIEKLNFVEAVQKLAQKYNIQLIYEGGYDQEKENTVLEEKASLRHLYTRVAGSFAYWLLEKPEGKECRAYLESRGIDAESIQKFGLGYAPKNRRWLFNFLSHKSFSKDFLAKTGLFSSKYPEYAFFSNRLMFPIQDRDGNVIAFGGRLLEGEGPKYLNSSDSAIFHKSQNLYALNLAMAEMRKTSMVYICEGYFDVIALHRAQVTNSVAPLGTALTVDQVKLLKRWCSHIVLVFDADAAGVKASLHAIQLCKSQGLSCSLVKIAEGKDPADILQEYGSEYLQKALKETIHDFDFLLEYASGSFDISVAEGKAQVANFMYPYLYLIDSEVVKSGFLDRISEELQLDRLALTKDFSSYSLQLKKNPRNADILPMYKKNLPKKSAQTIKVNDELFLMILLIVNRAYFKEFRSLFSVEDLDSQLARELYIVLEEAFRAEREDIDYVLERLEDESLRNFVVFQSVLDVYKWASEKSIQDSMRLLKAKKLNNRRSEIVKKIRLALQENYAEELINELIYEKKMLDDELLQIDE